MQATLSVALFCAVTAIPLSANAQSMQGLKVPPLAFDYQSAFSDYKPFEEQKVRPWRELNDEVSKAGGHIGILGGSTHPGHDAPKAPAAKTESAGQPLLRSAPEAPAGKPQH